MIFTWRCSWSIVFLKPFQLNINTLKFSIRENLRKWLVKENDEKLDKYSDINDNYGKIHLASYLKESTTISSNHVSSNRAHRIINFNYKVLN